MMNEIMMYLIKYGIVVYLTTTMMTMLEKKIIPHGKIFLIQYSAPTPDYSSIINEDTPFKLLYT